MESVAKLRKKIYTREEKSPENYGGEKNFRDGNHSLCFHEGSFERVKPREQMREVKEQPKGRGRAIPRTDRGSRQTGEGVDSLRGQESEGPLKSF